MNSLRLITNVLLTGVSVAYPLIWLFAEQHERSILFVLPYLMALLWGIKALQAVGSQRFFAITMTLILATVGITRSIDTMYWYPVVISLMMLVLFGGSLLSEQSLIERLARLQHPNLPSQAIIYTRKVTQIWCLFFIVNISITVSFILLEKFDYWAIYTGVISYILIGLLMVGEWLVRQRVMKKV
ncbi:MULTISPECIES: hypothetical protein [Glaesserella]|uniref:DNA gyrase subunit B n=1 Tax=Glaesserella australis TaxID=2094024 RepID=A0A328BYW3_9PAST|nr:MULTISPECIES: hypothetical protein [Glaesserella]AUI66520.1 hypothetical protein CJD39_07995 [Glaesserella sp. 15-184]RAL18831.1 hypothetical protein C5N92_06015 [Glaesserella australis]